MEIAKAKILEKRLNRWAWAITVVVLLLVGMMRRIKIDLPEGWDFGFLPAFHSTVNALTAIVLIMALYFIKQKQVDLHKKTIYVAIGLSVLFLLSYVVYHFTTPETIFGDTNKDGLLDPQELSAVGGSRTLYLILLLSHIFLAALTFPFILFTFIKAYTGQFEKHRKLARWVFPFWLYVAATGPIVYLMLKPYY